MLTYKPSHFRSITCIGIEVYEGLLVNTLTYFIILVLIKGIFTLITILGSLILPFIEREV